MHACAPELLPTHHDVRAVASLAWLGQLASYRPTLTSMTDQALRWQHCWGLQLDQSILRYVS